jgi:hypothetical protein
MSNRDAPCEYRQLVRGLPRPSAQQCEQFLHYLMSARPWSTCLPLDGGVAFTLLLNPQAGREPVRDRSGRITFRDRAAMGVGSPGFASAEYRAAFGHLDYASPVARGTGVLMGSELGLAPADAYYVLDDQGCAAVLPPGLVQAATCQLNAMVHPDLVGLLATLPLRVAVPGAAPAADPQLAPIAADAGLRVFAESYVREELAGFQCPDDRAAWVARQLETFRQLYEPRHAAQLAQLRRALEGLLAWVDG